MKNITNKKEHSNKWPYTPDHPPRILIIGGSVSGKIKTVFHLINERGDTDKIYLYAKDLSEPKYEVSIKKGKNAGTKHLNDSNAFIGCFNTMDNAYENIDDYNSSRKRKKIIFLITGLHR